MGIQTKTKCSESPLWLPSPWLPTLGRRLPLSMLLPMPPSDPNTAVADTISAPSANPRVEKARSPMSLTTAPSSTDALESSSDSVHPSLNSACGDLRPALVSSDPNSDMAPVDLLSAATAPSSATLSADLTSRTFAPNSLTSAPLLASVVVTPRSQDPVSDTTLLRSSRSISNLNLNFMLLVTRPESASPLSVALSPSPALATRSRDHPPTTDVMCTPNTSTPELESLFSLTDRESSANGEMPEEWQIQMSSFLNFKRSPCEDRVILA